MIDCRFQIAGAELAPALALGDDIGIESEDVAWLLDQPFLPERRDVFFAEPLDVEAVARNKMPEALDRLRGADQPAGAAPRDLARLAHREAAADWAVGGEFERFGILRAPVEDHPDNLRDHVAGALDDDSVADADILAGDLVLVVQG